MAKADKQEIQLGEIGHKIKRIRQKSDAIIYKKPIYKSKNADKRKSEPLSLQYIWIHPFLLLFFSKISQKAIS